MNLCLRFQETSQFDDLPMIVKQLGVTESFQKLVRLIDLVTLTFIPLTLLASHIWLFLQYCVDQKYVEVIFSR